MFTVEVTRAAARSLKLLDASDRADVDDVLAALCEDPRQEGCKPLNDALPVWSVSIQGRIQLYYAILDAKRILVLSSVQQQRRW